MTDTTTTDRWTAHRIELSNGIFECDCGDVSFPSTEAALDHLNAAAAIAPELVEALRETRDFLMDGTPDDDISPVERKLRTRISTILARLDQEANGEA